MKNKKSSSFSFADLRIFVLLLILFFVATDAWLQEERATDWDAPLWVAIYPINGDGSVVSTDYINALSEDDFREIEVFLAAQASRYQLSLLDPIVVKLAPEVKSYPPSPPSDGHVLKIMWWSLKLRYWAFVEGNFEGPSPDIRVFALFNDPMQNRVLPHSLGLEKGMLGVVHVYADEGQADQNNVVILHEVLHTVGAEDKYSAASGQPLYPEGYGMPEQDPLYPQEQAEIMGGRVALSETESEVPGSLGSVILGEQTAREIQWIRGS